MILNLKIAKKILMVMVVMLVTACEENGSSNNSIKYQGSMDNNIGSVQQSKQDRAVTRKISMTFESKIAGLYVAYFNRAPDLKGLNFWKNRATTVDSVKALKELSEGFAKHPTFVSIYKSMSNREFVEAIYHNVLSKAGDAKGIDYWTQYLDDGKSRSDMVSDFVKISLTEEVTGENFPTLTAQELAIAQERQDFITNKVEVALSFTTLLGTHTNIADAQHPENAPAYKASIKILSDVTGNNASVSTAIYFLNSIKDATRPIDRINNPTKTKGYLIDSPIQGVTYLCDGKEGLTDADGMFECVAPPVTFKIGNLTFGTLTAFTADKKVYPQDLLGFHRRDFSSPDLKLLARFIQSLDDDGDISKTIKIEEEVRDFFNAEQNFEDFSENDVKALLDKLGKRFVKECEALKHLGNNRVTCNSDGSYYVYTPPVSTPTPTPNTAPTANAQTLTFEEDTTANVITLTGTDADGDALTYEIVTPPTHGTLGGTAPNLTYTPTADYFGDDSFTFKANDGTDDSETVTVAITVTDVPETSTMAVKKTGQLLSYNEDGDEVADGSIKDDGFYQKGVELSYTRDDAKEIVEDHITGLMWQDDAEAKTISKPWVTQANYDAGNYSDTTGDTATTYCSNLTLGNYTDWRLPTVVELQGIVVDSKSFPTIDTTVFVNYTSNGYWSSTTYASYTNNAWGVYFYGGYTSYYVKSGYNGVRCVRAGQ